MNPARNPVHPGSRQRASGFTLLEVLIAVIIVSVGLLGIASLQLHTMQNGDGSKYRSLALTLSADMAERMRSNLSGSIGAAAVGSGYNRPRTAVADAGYSTPNSACRSTGCLPDEMALDDLATWQQRITASLPNGVGVVCLDSGTLGGAPTFNGTTIDPMCDNLGSMFAIKVIWLDNRSDNNIQTGGAPNTAQAYGAFVTRIAPMF